LSSSDQYFDKFWNVQKRGFYVEWIIDGNQLKILRFVGPRILTNSLKNGSYLKYYDFPRDERIESRYEWCRHFAIFSGELKLYDYEQMLDASKLGWLLGLKDNITLTIKAGEVVHERASKSYYRPNPFINLSCKMNESSLEFVFVAMVVLLLVLFLPLWCIIFWCYITLTPWPFDGLFNLCFYAFQVYWIYYSLKTMLRSKPHWLEGVP
jgi:hypothetical protein